MVSLWRILVKASRCSLVLSLAFLICGCGSSNLPKGDTGTVSGKVTFQGQPVPAGCQVIFVGAKGGMLGTGTVDGSGGYVLSMRGENNILVGSYRVAISPPKPHPDLSDEEIAKLAMEKKLPPTPEVKEVPQAYRSPETTPITLEVKKGDNLHNIDMKPM
jgi:hypothetical protein